jgi:hypothetical protein
MKAEMSETPEKLVGKYFHSANEANKIEWQGMVIGEPHSGWYLVQLYEWASGEPSVQRLVPIEKMISWSFYPDAHAMTFGSKRQYQKQNPAKRHEECENLMFTPRETFAPSYGCEHA